MTSINLTCFLCLQLLSFFFLGLDIFSYSGDGSGSVGRAGTRGPTSPGHMSKCPWTVPRVASGNAFGVKPVPNKCVEHDPLW